jgi:hypothetical protein
MAARRPLVRPLGPFAEGWDPYAPADPMGPPLPGGYPAPRAIPKDVSADQGSGDGSSSSDAPSRIARLLERQLYVRGRPGGSVLFKYDTSSLQNSVNSLQWQEIARLEGQMPQRCVIYSTYSQFGNLTGTFAAISELLPPRVLLRIRVGGGAAGGASNAIQIVPAGVPVAVTGENIYVDVGAKRSQRLAGARSPKAGVGLCGRGQRGDRLPDVF